MSRTIEQAERECREAWAKNPSEYGWCVHRGIEMERLTEPIENRIYFIINCTDPKEVVTRLDNLRPVLSPNAILAKETYKKVQSLAKRAFNEATAQAHKAYNEGTAQAHKSYNEATAPARKVYEKAVAAAAYNETIASAHTKDVPNHSWNGKSIF